MKTRRAADLVPNIDDDEASSAYIDSTAVPASDTNDSSSTHTSVEHDRSRHSSTPCPASPSNDAIPLTTTSNESPIPTTNIQRVYQSTVSNPPTRIDDHFGRHPRGRDAIAAFPNNVTNINPTNYTWIRGSSNYTLCHETSGEPTQALLWMVGNIENHSLDATTTYENWTVDVLLPTEADKALDNLLKTGPWKTFTKPNRYSILRTKATLAAIKDDLFDEDDEILASLGQAITAKDPFPYTYNGSMMVEGGTVPTAGYDATNFVNQTSIAVEVSILGYQMEGKEPGYSFGMRGVYHLGNPPRDATITPTKKRRGGCIISPRRRKATVFNADTSNFS
jgi:hypothetical protein